MGKILDDILVDIVDNEIQVSGPNIMEGYWNEPIQLSEVLINRNNKLWYKTGDSGYIKNDFLYYTGRINKK
jgi:long-chain acyl-CoA synthetase